MKKLLTLALLALAAFSAEGYKVLNKIKVGGTGGWDYLNVDPATQRVYASHGGIVEVVDLKAGKVVGQITQLHGVHGIAVASDVGKGFISNGQSGSVTVFDLKTLEKTGEPAVGGQNPDAICYEPKTQRIFTMNGRSNDSTAINAKNNEIIATFPVGEKPENCAMDGAGKLYVNIENSSEVVEIDAAKPGVTSSRWAPGSSPTWPAASALRTPASASSSPRYGTSCVRRPWTVAMPTSSWAAAGRGAPPRTSPMRPSTRG